MQSYDSLGDSDPRAGFRFFTGWVVLAQSLGLAAVIMVAVWMGNYRGGFAWQDNPAKEFNYHPLFMIIGMVFLYGNSILVYRVFRNDKKIYIKILHAVLHVTALIFASVGLKAVFDSHNLAEPQIPNLYSLHSWVGLATVILFGMQYVVGFVSFLTPTLTLEMRTRYKGSHVFWGIVIFVMAIATALIGINEKANWIPEYKDKIGESYLINILGGILVCLGITVVYIVTNPKFARQDLPDEEKIQLTS